MENKETMHKVISIKLAKASAIRAVDNACLFAIWASCGLFWADQYIPVVSDFMAEQDLSAMLILLTSCGSAILLQVGDIILNRIRVAKTKAIIHKIKDVAKKATKFINKDERFKDVKIKVLEDTECYKNRFEVFRGDLSYGIITSDSAYSTLVEKLRMNEEAATSFATYLNVLLDHSFKNINNDKRRKVNAYGKLNIPKITIDNLDDAFLLEGGYRFAIGPTKYLDYVSGGDKKVKRVIRKRINKLKRDDKAEIIVRILNGELVDARAVDSVVTRKLRNEKIRQF